MDAVSEVKARLSIEDVISEYVRLKRAGKNFKGLSPFTNEKTASFVVSPEKQIWHDFSSGRGGDVFTFVEEVEGLDFKDTLELLARKAGVNLEDYQKKGSSGSGVDKERLYGALDQAAKFYQRQLKASNQTLEYVIKQRGFNKQTVLDFQLGYSSNDQRKLVDYLLQKGFSQSELKLCGLVSSARGLSDIFRGRLMIPLHDQFGKVIGFTARILGAGSGPKYINTPSTPLYDKSRHIYGLHLAKQAIREKDYSVMVEGNLDVIASHQAGQKQIVASAGTALTEYQLKALSRLSPNVRLSFDQDQAGLAAAERAIPIASKTDVNLTIISLPSGKDPDELISKDPKLWVKAIENSDYAVDWLINRYKEKLDLSTAQGKRSFSDVMSKLLLSLDDPIEQDHYVKLISNIAGFEAEALRRKLSSAAKKELEPRLKQSNVSSNRPDDINTIKKIDKLLSLILMAPKTRPLLEILKPEMLINDSQLDFMNFIKNNPAFDAKEGPIDIKSTRQATPDLKTDMADYVKILGLLFDEIYVSVDSVEIQYEAERLVSNIVGNFVHQQKTKLAALLQQNDESEQPSILAKVRELDRLLSQVKKKELKINGA